MREKHENRREKHRIQYDMRYDINQVRVNRKKNSIDNLPAKHSDIKREPYGYTPYTPAT